MYVFATDIEKITKGILGFFFGEEKHGWIHSQVMMFGDFITQQMTVGKSFAKHITIN